MPRCSLNIVSALWQCRRGRSRRTVRRVFWLAIRLSEPASESEALQALDPLPAAQNESTGLSESLRAVEHVPGQEKAPRSGGASLTQRQKSRNGRALNSE